MAHHVARLPSIASSDNDDEIDLLEQQMGANANTGSNNGNSITTTWLSTHPRRRRSIRSMMTLWAAKGLLDESCPAQVSRLLSHIGRWDFNAFTWDRLTCGHHLSTLCVHLFREYGLLQHFRLDVVAVWKFFYLVEQGYHNGNPYHNAVHAADVMQAMHCFLQESFVRPHLSPVERMACIVAAVCHDLDHPGRNEKFLVATRSHLAAMYASASVLENHHWRSAVSCLWESGLAQALPEDDRLELQEIVRELILATDISRQQEFLSQFRGLMETGDTCLSRVSNRHLVLQIAIKCADISNPCRAWGVSRLWSYRACEEFFRQGDSERELNMTVTPFCDRFNISVAKVQAGFYRFVAAPLFEEWHRFSRTPLTTNMISNLISNQERWDQIVAQEARSVMAESVASQTSTSSSSNGGSSAAGPESRRQSLDPPQHNTYHQRMSRSSAEGDDDSDPASFPYMPLDSCEAAAALTISAAISEAAFLVRRHSLPTSGSLLLQPPEAVDEDAEDGKPRPSKRRPLESDAPRVTFTFGSSPMDDHDEDKENDWAAQSRHGHRRGSAPSSLLIGQLSQPLRLCCSRENSPTSAPPPPKNAVALAFVSRLNGCNRRGSLPADLLQLGHDAKTRLAKKRRLLTRHQSGSAVPQSPAHAQDCDLPLTSSSSSPHLLAVCRNNALSARRGSQPLAEPNTTELSLTVPVATLFPCRLSPLVMSAKKQQQHVDLLKCVSRVLPAGCHSLGAETTLDLLTMRRGSLPTELAVVESHAVQ